MTGRKPNFLNVREHIRLTNELIECFQKYGDCPLVRAEFVKHHFIGQAILRKADKRREAGNRKDLYMEAK
jgi:hypothetical protein